MSLKDSIKNIKPNFMKSKITGKKLVWFMISVSIIALACIMALIFWLCGLGAMNLGIDFSGGTVLEIRDDDIASGDYNDLKKMVETSLDQVGLNYSTAQSIENGFSIRFTNEVNGKVESSATVADLTQQVVKDGIKGEDGTVVRASLQQLLKEKYTNWDDARCEAAVSYSSVTATASTAVWLNALLCVAVAAALILIYVAIRFKISSGVAAIIALLHDVAIMISFVVIFHWQINAPFIAAMITIIGYSINNTIVIFDRVRENSKKATLTELNAYEMADLSVKQTMTRSINTSVTTLLTVVMLFILGVSAIREFTFPIIVGLLAGTYSSIFIAPSLWAMFTTNWKNRSNKKAANTPASKDKAAKENA